MSKKLVVWTPEIDSALLQAREDGLTFPRICDLLTAQFNLPFTRNGCIGRAHRLRGLPSRKVIRMPNIAAIEAPIAPLEAAPPPSRDGGLTILQLREGDCRWPEGERAPYIFCGQVCEIGKSFCPEHYDRVYHAPKVR